MDKRTFIFVILMAISFYVINNFFFPSSILPPSTSSSPKIETIPAELPPKKVGDETLYVIENEFQQLVISSKNGAIAEINLPFQDKNHPKSVVRKIREDEILQKDYPQSDQFPLNSYQTTDEKSQTSQTGGYYPLLRRNVAPQHYGLATLTPDVNTAQIPFHLKKLEKNLIELEGTIEDTRITKTYVLPPEADKAPYVFDLFISLQGNPQELYLTTGIPEVEIISGKNTPSLKYRMTKSQKGRIEQLSLPKTTTSISSIVPDWIANSNGFFALIVDPQTEMRAGFNANQIPGELVPTRLSIIDSQHALYPPNQYPGYTMQIPFKNQSDQYHFRIFAGPLATSVLDKVDAMYHVDYSLTKSFQGWFSFISEPFAKFLFFLMKIFYSVVHSWGIAIILLTVALRLMLYPLNSWSIKSTVKMQQLAPKLTKLQEKYKKEPKKAQMEILNLYREHGVNPLSGCFPLFIQMPFLIGMFDLLKTTFELRGASFIPGWINNLAAPDSLFTWSTPIWFIGNSFHLLPLLQGTVMYIQQKMSSPKTVDPSKLTDQQKQQKMTQNIMVVIFTILFYHFPSGLNIYWISSILLGILQQWWMSQKQMQKLTNGHSNP